MLQELFCDLQFSLSQAGHPASWMFEIDFQYMAWSCPLSPVCPGPFPLSFRAVLLLIKLFSKYWYPSRSVLFHPSSWTWRQGRLCKRPSLVISIQAIPFVSVLCLQAQWNGHSPPETHTAWDRQKLGLSHLPSSPETGSFYSQNFVLHVYDDFDQHFLLEKHPQTKHILYLLPFANLLLFHQLSLWGTSTGMWNCQYIINISQRAD